MPRFTIRCAANKAKQHTAFAHKRPIPNVIADEVREHSGTLSGFVCDTDTEFVDTASGRIIADIAISTVELGLCAMTLGLLLYCWKGEDRYKRIIHSVCEYACLVRSAFEVRRLFLHLSYI